jgi:hypothetical protein
MTVFMTPDPITIEVRNAAGSVTVDLVETTTSTVDIQVTGSNPFGFLDDLARAFRRPTPPPPGGPLGAGSVAGGSDSWPGRDSDAILERVRVDLIQRDGRDTLIVDTDPAARAWRSGFAIHISAPSGSGVRVASQSADVTVVGTADRLDVRTASGQVVAGHVAGAALAQTASGDVRIRSIGGELSARTASGDVEIDSVAGAAVVHSTSGDVRVHVAATDVQVRTVSGDVRVGDATRGAAEIVSVSGDVEIGVHPGTGASINLNTVSGDTRSDLEISDSPSDDSAEGGERPRASLDIRVRTTSGDIRLRRAIAA